MREGPDLEVPGTEPECGTCSTAGRDVGPKIAESWGFAGSFGALCFTGREETFEGDPAGLFFEVEGPAFSGLLSTGSAALS